MRVTILGTVLGDASYVNKDTKEKVGRLRVDTGEETVQCPCDHPESVNRFDTVVVTGDLRYFDKTWYFKSASIRVASRGDVEVLEPGLSSAGYQPVPASSIAGMRVVEEAGAPGEAAGNSGGTKVRGSGGG